MLWSSEDRFSFQVDPPPDLKKFLGKTIHIPQVGQVTIKSIAGNRRKPAFYEINGEHLIGMLRFHAQMLGDKSITEEQFLAFESMEMESEKLPDQEKKIIGMV